MITRPRRGGLDTALAVVSLSYIVLNRLNARQTSTPADLRAQLRARLGRQRTLVARLMKLGDQVPGSLFRRFLTCGKSGCACGQGEGHGPYHVLAVRAGGGTRSLYLRGAELTRARALVARHQRFRGGLREVEQLQADISALLRRYQEAM